jgi:hypothetical protein
MAFTTPKTEWAVSDPVTTSDLNRIESNEAQLAVYTGGWGTVTGSGTVFAVNMDPTPTAYVASLKITILWTTTNSGAPTLNVNGLGAKALLKANGSAFTANALKVGSVYTFVYNGTAFIAQGEGGEYGTATSAQVLAGYSLGTDSGLIAGSMVRRTGSEFAGYERAQLAASSPGRVHLYAPLGGYVDATADQGGNHFGVFVDDADFIPANFLATKTTLGLTGAIPVKTPDAGDQLAATNASAGAGVAYLGIAANSYHSGINWIRYSEPNLQPGNLRSGVSLFNGGITGSLLPGSRVVVNVATPPAGTPVSGIYELFRIPAGGSYAIMMAFLHFHVQGINGATSTGNFYMQDSNGMQVILTGRSITNIGSSDWLYSGFLLDKAARTIITKVSGVGYDTTWGGWAPGLTAIGAGGAIPAGFNCNGQIIFYFSVSADWPSTGGYIYMEVSGDIITAG